MGRVLRGGWCADCQQTDECVWVIELDSTPGVWRCLKCAEVYEYPFIKARSSSNA